MQAEIDTILHGDRIVHPYFGTVDLLNVLQAKGKRLQCGDIGTTSTGDGRDVRVRVKAVWADEKRSRMNDVVVIIAALPMTPDRLEGCAIEWKVKAA